MVVISGSRDPVERHHAARLKRVRTDVSVVIVPSARHGRCILNLEIKADITAFLDQQAAHRR